VQRRRRHNRELFLNVPRPAREERHGRDPHKYPTTVLANAGQTNPSAHG
jgi:hypothetical protein